MSQGRKVCQTVKPLFVFSVALILGVAIIVAIVKRALTEGVNIWFCG